LEVGDHDLFDGTALAFR